MGRSQKGHRVTLLEKSNALVLVPHPDGRSVIITLSVGPYHTRHFSLYRLQVPMSFWHLPPLTVKGNATRCAPKNITRLQQGFRPPENPTKLLLIARFPLPGETMIPTPDKYKDEQIEHPRDLYFDRQGNLYALYTSSKQYIAKAAVWNTRTKHFIRGHFAQDFDDSKRILRFKEGWGAVSSLTHPVTNALTGKSFPPGNYSTTTSDPDTGEFYRFAGSNIERYNADGRYLQNIINAFDVAIAARNGRLAAVNVHGGDGTGDVQVWQIKPRGKSKIYEQVVKGHSFIEKLELSADGRYLLVGQTYSHHLNTKYAIYHLQTGKQVGEGLLLAPFPGRANRGVVADIRPHRLAVWDYNKGRIIARLPRQRSRDEEGQYVLLRAAISDDGRLVASASYDGLVRVWDIDARRMVGEGRVGSEVTAMAFDLAGRRLAVGRGGGEIVIFEIPVAQ
jgi:WD40 repeat protein